MFNFFKIRTKSNINTGTQSASPSKKLKRYTIDNLCSLTSKDNKKLCSKFALRQELHNNINQINLFDNVLANEYNALEYTGFLSKQIILKNHDGEENQLNFIVLKTKHEADNQNPNYRLYQITDEKIISIKNQQKNDFTSYINPNKQINNTPEGHTNTLLWTLNNYVNNLIKPPNSLQKVIIKSYEIKEKDDAYYKAIIDKLDTTEKSTLICDDQGNTNILQKNRSPSYNSPNISPSASSPVLSQALQFSPNLSVSEDALVVAEQLLKEHPEGEASKVCLSNKSLALPVQVTDKAYSAQSHAVSIVTAHVQVNFTAINPNNTAQVFTKLSLKPLSLNENSLTKPDALNTTLLSNNFTPINHLVVKNSFTGNIGVNKAITNYDKLLEDNGIIHSLTRYKYGESNLINSQEINLKPKSYFRELRIENLIEQKSQMVENYVNKIASLQDNLKTQQNKNRIALIQSEITYFQDKINTHKEGILELKTLNDDNIGVAI